MGGGVIPAPLRIVCMENQYLNIVGGDGLNDSSNRPWLPERWLVRSVHAGMQVRRWHAAGPA
jgi:hypothetical protein